MAAGRVEQVTAIHRLNTMEFRTRLFNGDRYRQVTVIQSDVIVGSTVHANCHISTTCQFFNQFGQTNKNKK